MTHPERAHQIWPLLVWAAHNRQVLTYDHVSKATGVLRPAVGAVLGPIHAYCRQNGLPNLMDLVVGVNSGMPGHGFTAPEELPAVHAQVFAYDWLNHGCPSVAELEQALAASETER